MVNRKSSFLGVLGVLGVLGGGPNLRQKSEVKRIFELYLCVSAFICG
jgi:hypothetical protein